ncbi:MAG TPA: DivIVA domain-containing protein [Nitriliruptorales bacterium]
MLTPDEIASRQFLVSLRGYDRDEVDRFLEQVADTLAALQRQIRDLEDQAEAASARVPALRDAPTDVTPAGATAVATPHEAFKALGEETTRILVAAEESGRSIKQKAEERAQQELETARREARDEVESARRTASKVVSDAERRRNQIAEDARALEAVRDRLADQLREAVRATTGTMRGLAPASTQAPADDLRALATPEPAPARVEPAPASPAETDPLAESGAEGAEGAERAEGAESPWDPTGDEPASDAAASSYVFDDVADQEPEPGAEESEESEEDAESAAQDDEPVLVPAAATVDSRQQREQSLAAIRPGLLRRVKRALQDVQNDVLDALRRAGDGPDLETLMPGPESMAVVGAAGEQFLAEAYEAGLHDGALLAARELPDDAADASRVPARSATFAAVIAHEITAALRATLRAGIEAGEPATSLSERVGEIFRDLKGPVAEVTVDEHLSRTYGYGTLDAWSALDIPAKEWVPGVAPRCPEEMRGQNADAGAVELGAEFPTGQVVPPAHDGCDCTLVPR